MISLTRVCPSTTSRARPWACRVNGPREPSWSSTRALKQLWRPSTSLNSRLQVRVGILSFALNSVGYTMKINIINLVVDNTRITKSINVRYMTTVLTVWDFPKYRMEKKITYLRNYCNNNFIFKYFLLLCSLHFLNLQHTFLQIPRENVGNYWEVNFSYPLVKKPIKLLLISSFKP